MKPIRHWPIAIVAVIFMSGTFARAQVLEQVPSEALVVVKVANLQALSQKIGKLATELQLVALDPMIADPLAAVQDGLKIKDGLDKSGEAAFAFLNPATAGGSPDQSMLFLLPVSDYKAFVGNFAGAKVDAGIAEVTLPMAPMPAYIANWGKYAVLTPSKQIAAMKPGGVKVQGAISREVATKDVVVLANIPQIKAAVQPFLAQGRQQIVTEMEKDITGTPELQKFLPAIRVGINQLLDMAESFLRDAQAATYGINLGDTGINVTCMVEFDPSSYMGTLAKSVKNSDQSLLAGLPVGSYLMFGGSVSDPKLASRVMDDLIGPVNTELKKIGGPEVDAIEKYIDSIKKYVSANTGQAFGLVAPTAALGQESLIQAVSIQSGDAKIMKGAYQEMMSTQQDLMKTLGLPQDMTKTTTTPNGKTLDGVSFDLMHTEFNLGAAGPAAAQGQMVLTYLYGPNGMNMLSGVAGEKLLFGYGANDQTLSSTIAAIKGNADPLAKLAGVTAVSPQLPKSRVLAVYVPLDQIVTTVGTYLASVGMPVQIALPPDLQPVAATISTDGSAIRGDEYISTDLIKALVAQGMQIFMRMQGGGRGAGPGPGGAL